MPDVTHLAGNLWIGSAPLKPAGYQQFDAVYLVSHEWQPPSAEFPGIRLRRYPFDDSAAGLSRDDVDVAMAAANHVATDVVRGRRVLVTCLMGRNRSALVCSVALHMLTGERAVRMGELLRRKRVDQTGVRALSNPAMWKLLDDIDRRGDIRAAGVPRQSR